MYKILILLAVVLFSSCNEKAPGIIPFKENSKLNYINESPREVTEIISIKVISYEKGNGYDYVKLSSNPFFGEKEKEIFLKIDTKTGRIYSDDGGKQNMLLPDSKDIKKGYTWEYGNWGAIVSSENETVKAEKQKFENCIRIDYRISITFNSEIWIKPGVGIVKFSSYRTNPPSMSHTYYVWND